MGKKFDLIIPTLLESESDLQRCLKSLVSNSNYIDKIILIVQADKQKYNKCINIVQKFKELDLLVLFNKEKGLSKNRNLGLKYSNSRFICFPDDDCYFAKNFFKKLNFNGSDVILTKVIDPTIGQDVVKKKWPNMVTENNYKLACSVNMFIKKKDKVPEWHHDLGLGTEFPSGEDTYFCADLIQYGYSVKYIPDYAVYHPFKAINRDSAYFFNFSKGQGRLHKYLYEDFSIRNTSYLILLIGKLIFSRPNRLKKRWSSLKGYIYGRYNHFIF